MSRETGATLAELLVAVVLLSLLSTGVARLMTSATRALIHARLETVAVLSAQSRLEQLRALAWGFGSAHDPVSGTDTTTTLAGRDPARGGTGLAESPSTALEADTEGCVDYLDHAGRWVAGGTTPPPNARFVRRWRVRHAAGLPDLLILQVRVIDRRSELAEVVFATMRMRTAG